MKLIASVFCFLIVTSAPQGANAQDKWEITGKHEAQVGYMAKLKVTSAPGTDIKIKCTPENDDYFVGKDLDGVLNIVFVPGVKTLAVNEKQKLFTFIFASNKDGKTFLETFEITVTGDGTTPVTPPVTPPPVTPPPNTDPVSFHFIAVRAAGDASADYLTLMKLPGWQTLQKAGHKLSEMTLEDATELGAKVPSGTTLPFILKLKVKGKESTQVGGPIAFPKTDAAIANLYSNKTSMVIPKITSHSDQETYLVLAH